MTTTEDLGTILAIWAHPDDETYLAGGVMAAARDRGQRVVCASATAGERGTSDPADWPPPRLGRVRRWEAAAAMAVLAVDEHDVHHLPDGALADDEEAGLCWASQLLRRVGADTVLTFGPDGMTYHPDHIAVHRWVTQAWHADGCRARLLYATSTAENLERFGSLYEEWEMYMSDQRPSGIPRDQLAFHLELSGPALDRKVTALRAMATQTSDLVAAVDEDVFRSMVAEESFVAAMPSVAATVADLARRWDPHPELAYLRGDRRGEK